MDRPSVRARVRGYVPTLREFKPCSPTSAPASPVRDSCPSVNESHKHPTEVADASDALNVALRLQQRSPLAYTHMAGILVGFRFHGLAGQMRSFALAELDDARDLVEK